jgi:hypothetical protein
MKMLSTGRYLAALPHFPVSVIKDAYTVKEINLEDVMPIERNIYIMCSNSLKEQFAYQTFNKITKQVFAELTQDNKISP